MGNQIDAELCTPLPDVPDGTKITPEFLEACRRAKAGLDQLEGEELRALEAAATQPKRLKVKQDPPN